MSRPPTTKAELEAEIALLKNSIGKWYLQMGASNTFRKVYKFRARIMRATDKATKLKQQLEELRRQELCTLITRS
jgi:hypothetical protein